MTTTGKPSACAVVHPALFAIQNVGPLFPGPGRRRRHPPGGAANTLLNRSGGFFIEPWTCHDPAYSPRHQENTQCYHAAKAYQEQNGKNILVGSIGGLGSAILSMPPPGEQKLEEPAHSYNLPFAKSQLIL